MRSLAWKVLGSGVATAFVATCITWASPASAAEILVFQRSTNDPIANTSGAEAANILMAQGHTVTANLSMFNQLPADLSVFDEVFLVSISEFSDAEATQIVNYVKGGGRVYLSGDRPDPENDAAIKAVDQKIVKPLLATTVKVGNGLEGGDGTVAADHISVSTMDKIDFGKTPNVLNDWVMINPGIIENAPADDVIAHDAMNRAQAAIFTQEDLAAGSGCFMVVMDMNWWVAGTYGSPPPGDKAVIAKITQNIEAFLATCGDSDGDGITDKDELAIGTKPNNPDSDGDGLCDGTSAVAGVCVAGEDAKGKQNTDQDGSIDALDADDDNDGITTADELADVAMYGEPDDGDATPAYLDTDSDGAMGTDTEEGTDDSDSDGIPDYLDPIDGPNGTTSSDASTGASMATGSTGASMSTTGSGGESGSGGSSGDVDGGGGGCGCEVPGHGSSPAPLAALALALAPLARRLRRRRS